MTDFSHILNWKLLENSHEFPGSDGGTCINEAAIVAAGMPYRAVKSAKDCPPCFSPVLSEYLLRINDAMPDVERQSLMRFVMRLPGSADTIEIEYQRVGHIALQTVRRILPLFLEDVDLDEQARQCRSVTTLAAAAEAAKAAKAAAKAAGAAGAPKVKEAATAAAWAADAVAWSTDAVSWSADAVRWTADAAAWSATDAAAWSATDRTWVELIVIIDEAFAIGQQADPLDVALVQERMEATKLAADEAREALS